MSKPKYLPIPKKIPYNIRLPKHLLDKLNAYAELTGNTTTDIVIGALNDFIKDKTVFNDYLPYIKGISIRIPIISSEKVDFYNTNLIGENSAAELYHEAIGYAATTEAYEILKIPNNLDIFTETFGYVKHLRVMNSGNHSGIEFVILPDVYLYYDNESVFDALYCFYFNVKMDKLESIKIIDYMDAINKANESNNETLKNQLVLCVNELAALENKVKNGGFDGVEFAESTIDDVTNAIVDELETIAKTYNTGNIIKLGENVDKAIATVKINENPELYDVFMDDVKDNTEKYMDEVIADRVAEIVDYRLQNIEKLVRNAKSKDEILIAIGDNKIKTKKE